MSIDRVPVEEWNKAVVFRSERLGAVLTYTGVAGRLEREEVGDWAGMPKPSGTADWLAQRICRVEGAKWDLGELADQIRQAADDLFSTFPQAWVDRHTAFTLAGWDRAGTQPRGYHIHNCLDEHARMTSVCHSAFAVQAMDVSQPDHYAGISDAVHRRHRKRIRQAVRSGVPAERIVEPIVKAFRSAANIEPRISYDCLTILLPPTGNAQARFHSESPFVHGPTTVVCGRETGTYIIVGPLAEMPEGTSCWVGDHSAGLATQVSRG
jgi:hypothetical protein